MVKKDNRSTPERVDPAFFGDIVGIASMMQQLDGHKRFITLSFCVEQYSHIVGIYISAAGNITFYDPRLPFRVQSSAFLQEFGDAIQSYIFARYHTQDLECVMYRFVDEKQIKAMN